jgi:hypothetical protein
MGVNPYLSIQSGAVANQTTVDMSIHTLTVLRVIASFVYRIAGSSEPDSATHDRIWSIFPI